jgi:hypothetical protein
MQDNVPTPTPPRLGRLAALGRRYPKAGLHRSLEPDDAMRGMRDTFGAYDGIFDDDC